MHASLLLMRLFVFEVYIGGNFADRRMISLLLMVHMDSLFSAPCYCRICYALLIGKVFTTLCSVLVVSCRRFCDVYLVVICWKFLLLQSLARGTGVYGVVGRLHDGLHSNFAQIEHMV
ncbi:hypothetical protein QVD17_03121 [Tagetes erecta]|uniref:Uncharacterized protein n=1 Tax=Tagetes erecta TaxID=13708 RepID=A0AAD8L7T6_TARER|nr:hypothetical protein QVD17_03121 [Tagetes erecta]